MGTIPELDGIVFPSSQGSALPQAPSGRRPTASDATPGLVRIIFPSILGRVLMTAGSAVFRLLFVMTTRSGEETFLHQKRKEGVAMNEPTSILEQAQPRTDAAGKRGVMTTTTRRGVCVLALVLLFMATGVGSVPNRETGAQKSPLGPIPFDHGLTPQLMADPAWADTLANADQEGVDNNSCGGLLSTRARFKTH
jgi:hypothetical protein